MSEQEKTFLARIRKVAIPLPLVIVIALFSTALGVYAATGTTDSPDTPANTNSYTLKDIYQRLDAGTTASQSTFTEPAAGPGTGTMHTLNDIMGISPALDASGATTAEVKEGQTFWGLTDGEWGLQTGTYAYGKIEEYIPCRNVFTCSFQISCNEGDHLITTGYKRIDFLFGNLPGQRQFLNVSIDEHIDSAWFYIQCLHCDEPMKVLVDAFVVCEPIN
ncbi:MAG: hypothetical protein HN390_03540 [Anaerolineae bacterium]|jgi:hypothetical protein|nr:hypothetical protein [Anaerolineae bacterium]MBT7189232.1 hypothetical protein [Anaerolineae bacterium]MBT7991401.1 hypothetical protein [Anaerolineae bacterium]